MQARGAMPKVMSEKQLKNTDNSPPRSSSK